MSRTDRRRTALSRRLCQHCRDRKARFGYRGAVRADRDHPPSLSELRRASTVCFECYRRELNRARARRLVDRTPPIQCPFVACAGASERVFNEHQIAHRQRMLEHLRRQANVAS